MMRKMFITVERWWLQVSLALGLFSQSHVVVVVYIHDLQWNYYYIFEANYLEQSEYLKQVNNSCVASMFFKNKKSFSFWIL